MCQISISEIQKSLDLEIVFNTLSPEDIRIKKIKAQKILFEALENLTAEHNQVFVTTHSPMFFSPQATGTFIKVIKEYPATGKPFGKFLTINLLKEIEAKDAFQIICYENNTAAFFSNKVL